MHCIHCYYQVKNYLPSLSAAMGGFPLSQTIWRVCIGLHALPRFMVTAMYYRYLTSIILTRHVAWAVLACLLNILENLGLIGLTYVSSRENYRKTFANSFSSKHVAVVLSQLFFHNKKNILTRMSALFRQQSLNGF